MCQFGDWSAEDHARLEGHSLAVDGYEPLPRLLEDALTRLTELREQSIEAGLGRVALPTTIKDGHEVIADFGDLVSMEADDHHVLFFIVVDGGVRGRPIATGSDGGVHLGFDLAHLKFV